MQPRLTFIFNGALAPLSHFVAGLQVSWRLSHDLPCQFVHHEFVSYLSAFLLKLAAAAAVGTSRLALASLAPPSLTFGDSPQRGLYILPMPPLVYIYKLLNLLEGSAWLQHQACACTHTSSLLCNAAWARTRRGGAKQGWEAQSSAWAAGETVRCS